MVAVFAREITDDLASLVKQIDEVVGKNEEKKMAAFLVLLSEDSDAASPPLETLAEKHSISHTPLTVFDGVAGPSSYKIAEEADVTVLLWVEQKVKVNHAFAKGELNAEKIKEIVKTTDEILE